MPDQTPFAGFEAPTENYYRLPNTWFSEIIPLLRDSCGDRFASALKLLEFLISHIWRFQEYGGQTRLSAREIRNGKKYGPHQDLGTGLSENTVTTAGRILNELGLITIAQDPRDLARRLRTYSIWIVQSKPEQPGTFEGFVAPVSNYFILPKSWINLIRNINSAALIVIVEYFIRHAWGYNNEHGSWLRAEEIVHGRAYKTSDKRYDNGTGFDIRTVYRALAEAIKLGFITYTEIMDDNHQLRKVYNLRLASMIIDPKTGQCLSHLPPNALAAANDTLKAGNDIVKAVTDKVKAQNPDAVEADSDIIEAGTDTVKAGTDTVTARSLKDTHILKTTRKTPPTASMPVRKSKSVYTRDADAVILPEELLLGLEKIKWTSTIDIVVQAYAKNPQHVLAWMNFALHAPNVKTPGGLFRKGILSNNMPSFKPEPRSAPAQSDDEEEEDILKTAIDIDIKNDPPETLVWQQVISHLEKTVPKGHFEKFIQTSQAMELVNNILIVRAQNQEALEWMDDRIRSTAEKILIGISGTPVTVQFVSDMEHEAE